MYLLQPLNLAGSQIALVVNQDLIELLNILLSILRGKISFLFIFSGYFIEVFELRHFFIGFTVHVGAVLKFKLVLAGIRCHFCKKRNIFIGVFVNLRLSINKRHLIEKCTMNTSFVFRIHQEYF